MVEIQAVLAMRCEAIGVRPTGVFTRSAIIALEKRSFSVYFSISSSLSLSLPQPRYSTAQSCLCIVATQSRLLLELLFAAQLTESSGERRQKPRLNTSIIFI